VFLHYRHSTPPCLKMKSTTITSQEIPKPTPLFQ
jgi:hypothetical protein